jgi:hypothetical protein
MWFLEKVKKKKKDHMWQNLAVREEVLPMVITLELEGGGTLDLVRLDNPVDEEIMKEFERQSLEITEELQASSNNNYFYPFFVSFCFTGF